MEFTDEQLEVHGEYMDSLVRERETMDGVILSSVVADSVGNLFFITEGVMEYREGYGGFVPYAAYHYDKRVGELNVIVSDVSYADCVAATGKFREGRRVS